MVQKQLFTSPLRHASGSMLPLALLVSVNILALLIYHQGGSCGQPAPPRAASLLGATEALLREGIREVIQPQQQRSLVALMTRVDIPATLQAEGLKSGAELGVQVGDFAAYTLRVWTACERYYLVDLWGHQPNYEDVANVADDEQERRFQLAKTNLAPWNDKTVFLRNYTVGAAKQIPDDSLDYIYVDARHDYCGVMEDLEAYWPKLRRGGILAGHDYLDANDTSLKQTNQDWSLCLDGTRNMGAVKGAVDEFARRHGLHILATYREPSWPSWLTRKP